MDNFGTRSSEEKIRYVAEQITLCEKGFRSELECPYCGVVNKQGEKLCCNLFAAAAMAVIDSKEIDQQLEVCQILAEKVLAN